MRKTILKSTASFALLCLVSTVILLPLSSYSADTIPPIPKPRPKIVHVSPDYIKKLSEERNKSKQTEHKPAAAKKNEPQTSEIKNKEVKPVKAIPVDREAKIDSNTLHDTTRLEVLEILDGKDQLKKDIKPEEISPAASGEKTTISFSLNPAEHMLNKEITTFLEENILKTFNENPAAILEINAFATPVKGEKNSSMRISLARSLEIRKWLIEKNIPASRLKLNTIRNAEEIESDDRIDLILIQ